MATLDRKTPPPVRDFEFRPLPPQTIGHLPGATLHIIDNGELPANRVTIAWHYGVCHSISQTGGGTAASLVPALMLEGTDRLNGQEIAEAFDFNGAMVRQRATDRCSLIDMLSINDTTPALLDIIGHVFTSATLPQKAFEALRAKGAQRRAVDLTRPVTLAMDAVSEMIMGPGHPYLRIATPQDIMDTTPQDVRLAYETGCHSAPVDIYYGGRMDAKIEKSLHKLASLIHEHRNSDNVCHAPIHHMKPSEPQERHIAMEGSLQTAVAAAIPAIDRSHPDYIPLRLTVMALGGYFGSRLMTNIREEKGLTYGISAALHGTHEGAYTFISAQCAAGTAPTVLTEIKAEIAKLASTPMPADELHRLKSYAASQLMAILDTPMAIADHYLNQAIVGTPPHYFESQFRAIENLDADTLMLMATRYLQPAEMRIATAGA